MPPPSDSGRESGQYRGHGSDGPESFLEKFFGGLLVELPYE